MTDDRRGGSPGSPQRVLVALLAWVGLVVGAGWFHQQYGLTNPLGPQWFLFAILAAAVALLVRALADFEYDRVWAAVGADLLGVVLTVLGIGPGLGCGDGPMPLPQRCEPTVRPLGLLLLAGFVFTFVGVVFDPGRSSSSR